MKSNERFNQLTKSAQHFITREWIFHRDNISKMMVDVETLKDNEIVRLNRCVDWKQYIAIYMVGIEKFILKEKSKPIDARRQRLSVYVQKYFHIERKVVVTIYRVTTEKLKIH